MLYGTVRKKWTIDMTIFSIGYVSDGDVLQYDIQSRQILATDPGYMSEGPVYNDSKWVFYNIWNHFQEK